MDKFQYTDVIVLFVDMNYINFEEYCSYEEKYNTIVKNIMENTGMLDEYILDSVLENLLTCELVRGVLLPNDDEDNFNE